MAKFGISINVKNAEDARAVQRALKEKTTMATVLILGHLSGLRKDQQIRAMAYVVDRLRIKVSK